jgi:hypothetical protein
LEYFDLPVDPNHQGHQVGPDGDDEKDWSQMFYYKVKMELNEHNCNDWWLVFTCKGFLQ